jgi:hypothetical protein
MPVLSSSKILNCYTKTLYRTIEIRSHARKTPDFRNIACPIKGNGMADASFRLEMGGETYHVRARSAAS